MSPELSRGLSLASVGLLIVFLVLGATALMVRLVRHLDEHWQRHEQVKDQLRKDRTPTIDATTAVLISAAVATILGGGCTFDRCGVSFRPRPDRAVGWPRAGRRCSAAMS